MHPPGRFRLYGLPLPRYLRSPSCPMEGAVNRYKISPIKRQFQIRELSSKQYVVEVHWPSGAIKQLVGVFTSKAHAEQWLASSASTLPSRQSSKPTVV